MTTKNKNTLQPPISYSKENFINSINEEELPYKGRPQAVTFALNAQDIKILNDEIDRAIRLGKRTKSKAAIIRMALRSLNQSSDEEYLGLYSKF